MTATDGPQETSTKKDLHPDDDRALRAPARSGDKRNGLIICAEPGCPGVNDAVYRTNPKGERGVFKCAEHAFSTGRDYRTR